jgi:7,8-dihydropterin-6-yl-methyl-4-(beta-D-ribofuranosyl)aminobenzene 5'-phosphate synthase
MRVTTLIENRPSETDARLSAEWGLSLHVAWEGRSLLFDTGSSGAFADNAEILSVDLAGVEAAVLSHHHYDHGGGLRRFFAANRRAKVYVGAPPDGECVGRLYGLLTKQVGLAPDLFRDHADRFVIVAEPAEILPGVHVLPRISGDHPRPPGNRHLFVRNGRSWRPDDFSHEIVVAVEDGGGLVVFTGCSHSGILNMVETVGRAFPGVPIRAVIGGFHLVSAPPLHLMAGRKRDVEDLASRVLAYPVGMTYTGHCTGERAFRVLQSVMGGRIADIRTGSGFEI